MNDLMPNDPLRSLLREWQPPEPTAEMDARMFAAWRAAWRAADPPASRWNFWSAQVSVPVPVFAVAVLVLLALLLQFRPAPAVTVRGPSLVTTQVDAEGFQPLPDGAARVVKLKGISQ